MILERANNKVANNIERIQQVQLKLNLGDDSYTYMGRYSAFNMKVFDILKGECWVYYSHRMYYIDH